MQACAGSHHRAHTLATVWHQVKLISAQRVLPLKSNKNDFVDAEAIRAASCPVMRFVPPKTECR